MIDQRNFPKNKLQRQGKIHYVELKTFRTKIECDLRVAQRDGAHVAINHIPRKLQFITLAARHCNVARAIAHQIISCDDDGVSMGGHRALCGQDNY